MLVALRHLRKNFKIINSSREMKALAAEIFHLAPRELFRMRGSFAEEISVSRNNRRDRNNRGHESRIARSSVCNTVRHIKYKQS